jgi:hypothetical protein
MQITLQRNLSIEWRYDMLCLLDVFFFVIAVGGKRADLGFAHQWRHFLLPTYRGRLGHLSCEIARAMQSCASIYGLGVGRSTLFTRTGNFAFMIENKGP